MYEKIDEIVLQANITVGQIEARLKARESVIRHACDYTLPTVLSAILGGDTEMYR